MKVNVRVANEYVDKGYCYTFNCGDYEVQPFKITRTPAGSVGAAKSRYYYMAHFIGFDDMLDCHNKSLRGIETRENIIRRQNPKFNPKKLVWLNNTARLV
jgi:hypothetical protein